MPDVECDMVPTGPNKASWGVEAREVVAEPLAVSMVEAVSVHVCGSSVLEAA